MCNTQGAAFCLCAPSRPHFSIIKNSCKEGKAVWGSICALRAAAAGPARQAFCVRLAPSHISLKLRMLGKHAGVMPSDYGKKP